MEDRKQYLKNILAEIKASADDFHKVNACLNGEIFLEEIRMEEITENPYLQQLIITRDTHATKYIKAVQKEIPAATKFLSDLVKSFEQNIKDEIKRLDS